MKYMLIGCLGLAFAALGCARTAIVSEPLYFWEVESGDCTNIPAERRALRIVPCDESHDAEVYAKGAIGDVGEGWPGDLILSLRADELCHFGFWDYFVDPELDSAPSEFDDYLYWWYSPDEESWDLGVRTAVCLVQNPEGQLKGRLRWEPESDPGPA